MKRILFVDDEPNVLEGLERMLFPSRKKWQMTFARGGPEALRLMEQETFDIIVSDMRMPGMDGAALLAEVVKRYPETVRIILTGQTDRDTLLRSVGVAHQFVAKPCNPQLLKSCIERAFGLRDLLDNEALKQIISRIDTLPTLPEAYSRLVKELESPESSLATVGKIIESDLAMTAKVLQLVTSAFFGLRQRISSATQAVTFLGLDTIEALALVAGVFSQAKTTELTAAFSLNALWHHSILVGSYVRAISASARASSKNAGASNDSGKDAFTAGLLHDVGMLVLADNATDSYRDVLETAQNERKPVAEAEQAAFGCTHAEVGAYLLGIWGLPDPIVEAVAFHHSPSRCAALGFTPLTAVHVADVFAHEAHSRVDQGAQTPTPRVPLVQSETKATQVARTRQLDTEYLDTLGFHGCVEAWRETCLALCGEKEKSL